MKKTTWAALIAIVAISFLYIGTTHRDRCMKASEVGCTILPWSGHSSYVLGSNGWGDTSQAVIP